MQVVVATHGHCFDGLASAVLFTELLRSLRGPDLHFAYRSCGYGVGQPRPEGRLGGDENALLDYRYSQDPTLTWYFDHHRTAFVSPADRAHFAAHETGGRHFFDASCSSCTKLIRDVGVARFGLDPDTHAELCEVADRVDAARYASPEDAIGRADPVQQLVAVVENHGNDALLAELVPLLRERPLQEVATLPAIRERYQPLGKRHEKFVGRVRRSAERLGRVVLVDLTNKVVSSVEKFVTYALYPDAVYSVVVGLRRNDVNVSVGYNPWSGSPLDADISAICARHGGGGHAVVGAISFALGELERARSIARSIATELAG